MKARTVALFLALILLPTASLSFLASRAIRRWEHLWAAQLEDSAKHALHAVSSTVESLLISEAEAVRTAISDVLATGADSGAMERVAQALRVSRPLVHEVWVFVNPWGLAWPPVEETSDASVAPGPSERSFPDREALLAVLRRETGAPDATDTVRFRVGDTAYWFARVQGTRQVYVGMSVNRPHLLDRLTRLLEEASRGGLRLSAEGPGWSVPESGSDSSDVVVEDSLLPYPVPVRLSEELQPLATVRLAAPLDFVWLRAYSRDIERMRHLAAVRARFSAWAVGLLAMGAVVGVILWLRESAEEIRRAQTQAQWVAGASHDLRTPLAAIRVLTESLLLGRVRDPERERSFLTAILRESERLSYLVERVLMLVRVGQGTLTLAPRWTEIGAWIQEVVRAFQDHWALIGLASSTGNQGGPRVVVHVAPSLPPAHLDAGAMTQVLMNLLDNAVQYGMSPREGVGSEDASTRRSSESAPVELTVEPVVRRRPWHWNRRRWVCMAVRDHGPGIAAEERRRLFRPFHRGTAAQQRHASGVGLGLVLSRRIVEAHRGWIEVDSRPGSGTTVRVYLPAGAEEQRGPPGGEAKRG